MATNISRPASVDSTARVVNMKVFTPFADGDVVENQKTYVTTGVFSGNAASLNALYSSSLQTSSSKQYYYEVWNGTDTTTNEGQFSVAYGHRLGSGSSANGSYEDSPTKAIYSQYKLLCLDPGDISFDINGVSTDSIYVVNFNRARLKDKLDPGNWQLGLAGLDAATTGSAVVPSGSKYITLIDNSGQSTQTNLTAGGRVYNIISGTIAGGPATDTTVYGLCYPDLGILILNGSVLDASASFGTSAATDTTADNAWRLFKSISGSCANSSYFYARNEEAVTSAHYFVRVKNGEYNFSNNPTFVTGSLGEFAQPTFIGDPKTYVTTIGLYNDRQELLAVAKLSQPVQKSFSKEALIKVRLDF